MLRSLGALVLVGLLVGCGQQDTSSPLIADGPADITPSGAWPELLLERREAGRVAVVLRGVEARRPRMAEVRVRWSEGWSLKSHAPGQAALAADKQVHVRPVSPTEVRVLVFASGNTERMGDGTLAELAFEGTGAGTAEILPAPPMLAPPEAEAGLHLGDPIPL